MISRVYPAFLVQRFSRCDLFCDSLAAPLPLFSVEMPLDFGRLASELIKRQSLADNALYRFTEALRVRHVSAIEPIRLFVKIPEQMKRLNAYISAANPTLQERPEVLKTVSVDLPSTY
jgi:hypothetical protein